MKRLTRTQIAWTLGAIAVYTAIAALFFSYRYFDDLARQTYGTWGIRLVEEATGAYTALVLLPFIVWVARRFRPTLDRWYVTPLIWLAGAIIYSAAHTTLMALSREVIYRVLGWGDYHYGIMTFRYPMEASNDVIWFFVIASTINFLDRMAAARRAELAAAGLQTKLAEAKLENLRLQLHPHFLFNTLNAISSVMYEDVQKADEMLSKLSDFLRVVLASSGVNEVPLDEELAVERMYVDIMTTRLERQLSLDIHVAEDAREASVPFMLLQPLLENSIRHGMGDGREALDLGIDVRRTNGSTVISVSDDGAGFNPVAQTGIGLNNVSSRLEQMYGKNASFSIERRSQGGTLATLRFPFSRGAA